MLSDVALLQGVAPSTFTHYSEAHGSTSWIDHVVCTSNSYDLMDSIQVDTAYVISDHFPVLTCINWDKVCVDESDDYGLLRKLQKIDWDNFSAADLEKYKVLTEQFLAEIPLEHELLLCDDNSCQDPCHISAIPT